MSFLWWLCSLVVTARYINCGSVELEAITPVYYKSGTIITANLIDPDRLKYKWYFNIRSYDNQDSQFREGYSTSVEVPLKFAYAPEKPTVVEVDLEVEYTSFFFPQTFARNRTTILVSNKLPIRIECRQNGTLLEPIGSDTSVITVCSGLPMNATVQFNDPSEYFNDTSPSIYWTLNQDEGVTNGSFTKTYPTAEGRTSDSLKAVLTLLKNNSVVADGGSLQTIKTKDPISNVTAIGDLWLRRGQLVQLTFTCNGSPPFEYCLATYTARINETEFDCAETDYHLRDICKFTVTRYFSGVGDHRISIKIRNVINKILKTEPYTSSYKVHIYDVESEGLLTLFILPISSFILGLIVVVSAVALYKHTKGDMRVEVADFDFGGASTAEEIDAVLEERTFWSHIRDELAESSRVFKWLARERTTSEIVTDQRNVEEHLVSGDGSIAS